MGRLFWKFFLFIWLVQLAGIFGTSTFFWLERQQAEARWQAERAAGLPAGERPPPFHDDPARRPPPFPDHPKHRPPPPGSAFGPGHPPGPPPGGGRAPAVPMVPLLAALLVSLTSAFGLAWYFAKPIRQLRRAFDAAAEGDLAVRIGNGMGGRRDELADLGRDFDRMSERLRALVDGQKRLLHDVSHEMRSPLARLQAAIGLARQQPGRMADSLARIEREGERMNVLVGELLTLSRLEAGVGGALEDVDLTELLADVVEAARFEGAARRIEVDFVCPVLPVLRANGELLHRAIENIVRNALRFSPPGGVVRIEAGAAGDALWLRVSDQGPGVAEDELELIFKPFYRGAGQATGSGHGLGLAIARRVIAAVNGEIRAKNGDAGGLVVDVVLPA